MNELIGTIVKGTSGPSEYRIGKIADVRSSRWGDIYDIVLSNGEFVTASTIDDEETLGIGWAVASQEDIDRHNLLAQKCVDYLESGCAG